MRLHQTAWRPYRLSHINLCEEILKWLSYEVGFIFASWMVSSILKKALSDCNPYNNIIFKKKLPHWRIGLSSPKKLPLPNQTWNQRSFGNHQIHKVAVFFHQLNSWCRNNFHKVQPGKYGFAKIFIKILLHVNYYQRTIRTNNWWVFLTVTFYHTHDVCQKINYRTGLNKRKLPTLSRVENDGFLEPKKLC